MATKDKKDKKSEFPSPGGSGVSVCLRDDKNSRIKILDNHSNVWNLRS